MASDLRTWFDAEELDRERWRPLVEGVVARVAAAAAADRLAHGLLLVGPQGMGRELAAVEIAALLTCPEGPLPWCDCGSCRRVRAGTHPDVVALFRRLDRKTGKVSKFFAVDPMRDEVVTAADGRPYEGRRRVWVFSSVHTGELHGIGREAANAFLKTLEEPPAHCAFLLLAANPDAVLPTIRSRCQRLTLPGLLAVARARGHELAPELVAEAVAGLQVADEIAALRDALDAGSALELVRAARRAAAFENPFELVAATCIAAAAEGNAGRAEELVRLAGRLIAAGRRTGALNLVAERQLVSCLLDWHRSRDRCADPAVR